MFTALFRKVQSGRCNKCVWCILLLRSSLQYYCGRNNKFNYGRRSRIEILGYSREVRLSYTAKDPVSPQAKCLGITRSMRTLSSIILKVLQRPLHYFRNPFHALLLSDRQAGQGCPRLGADKITLWVSEQRKNQQLLLK